MKAKDFNLTTVDLFKMYRSYRENHAIDLQKFNNPSHKPVIYNGILMPVMPAINPGPLLSISQYIRDILKNMAVGSHGDIVWISRRTKKQIWRQQAIYPNSVTEKMYYEDNKPTAGKYADHNDQGNEHND